jgi:hypothetical protein
MNTKKLITISNLFEFAEARLQNLVSRGDMEYYTALDVIDNAIKIREYLDKNPKGLKIPTQTKEERREMIRKSRMNYYYKTGGY